MGNDDKRPTESKGLSGFNSQAGGLSSIGEFQKRLRSLGENIQRQRAKESEDYPLWSTLWEATDRPTQPGTTDHYPAARAAIYKDKEVGPDAGAAVVSLAIELWKAEADMWKHLGINSWVDRLLLKFSEQVDPTHPEYNYTDETKPPAESLDETPMVSLYGTPAMFETELQSMAGADDPDADMLPLAEKVAGFMQTIGEKGRAIAEKVRKTDRKAWEDKSDLWVLFRHTEKEHDQGSAPIRNLRYLLTRALWFDVVKPELERMKGRHPSLPGEILRPIIQMTRQQNTPSQTAGRDPEILDGDDASIGFLRTNKLEQYRRKTKGYKKKVEDVEKQIQRLERQIPESPEAAKLEERLLVARRTLTTIQNDALTAVVNQHVAALKTIHCDSLLRQLTRWGYQRYYEQSTPKPRTVSLEFVGGVEQLSAALGFGANDTQGRKKIRQALEALDSLRFSGPGIEVDWLLALGISKASKARQSIVTLTLNWPLLPSAGSAIAKLQRPDLDPLLVVMQPPGGYPRVGRANEYAQQGNLNHRINMHMTQHSPELVAPRGHGGIVLPASDWEKMMDAAEIPASPKTREDIRNRYFSPPVNSTGLFPFFDSVDGDRELVRYRDAKTHDFLVAQGEYRLLQSKLATAGAKARKKKRQ